MFRMIKKAILRIDGTSKIKTQVEIYFKMKNDIPGKHKNKKGRVTILISDKAVLQTKRIFLEMKGDFSK